MRDALPRPPASTAWSRSAARRAARLAEAAIAAGLPAAAVTYVPTSAAAAALVASEAGPGDLVLVKGSRGVGTDAVVARLMTGGA